MLSIEQLRKIDPSLKNLTDKDFEIIRAKLYDLGKFAFEEWLKRRNSSKTVPIHPIGLSLSISGSCRM
ncbi:MAG: hypothetical protein WC884_04010 [Candidatus Paceibacterota bacterium]